MAQESSDLHLLTLGLLLGLACEATMTTTSAPGKSYFPFPTLTVNLFPGFFNITWDCNPSDTTEDYHYSFIFQHSPEHDVRISDCFFAYHLAHEREFPIHDGLHVRISASKGGRSAMQRDVMVKQGGRINSSAEKFSCSVYNVFIMNCSWTVGKEAPKDTRYSLTLRHETSDRCEDYTVDSFGRQIGCIFRSPNVPFDDRIYFQVVGSSKEVPIQFLDGLFKPNDYVILDPPRNITLKHNENDLEITWEPPKTKTSFYAGSFQYSINISGVITDDLRGMSFKTNSPHEKVIVSMRARIRDNDRVWSRWSEPLSLDAPHVPESHNYLFIIGIVPAVLLIALIVLCYRLQIWKRLFPQVPQPAERLFDEAEQKELLNHGTPMNKCLSETRDDEECICSHITEMTQREQPAFIA